MNVFDTVPEEARKLQERNVKYAEIIAQSMKAQEKDLERLKDELALAPSEKELIYSECSLRLYRFTPRVRHLQETPLLIVPSLILRYYIMDLLKGHSLIEHLVNSGIDTYLVDWGVPGDEHGELTFDYYIDTFLRRMVRKVARHAGSGTVNLLGQCLGGTMAAIFTSLYPEKVERLVCLTAPIDFKDAGLLALWTRKDFLNVDKVVSAFGRVIPADFIHSCFQFLDVKATIERYKKLYNNVLDSNFLYYYRAMDTWLNDKIPFPGLVFKKFIKELYQGNLLARGKLTINERAADLGAITCPVQIIAAEMDHVFPVSAASALVELVNGPVDYRVVSAGHVTLIALLPQREETFRHISSFLSGESDIYDAFTDK
ncbi:MAG: alpha/beta fold hydrolase [Candidatus Xenobiia bacterium LiM19]